MKKEIINKMINSKYKTTLKGVFLFELKSFLGRIFKNKQPKLDEKSNYLHLGCGTTYLEDYINADFFSSFKFWKKYKHCPDWMLDLRFPMNCPDSVWDGVFTEHAMEHLYPDQVLKVFLELNRTMKEGAVIRIVVPDLQQCVDRYQQQDQEISGEGASIIWDLTQNWMHLSVWDFKLMSMFLAESGFCNIKKLSYGMGSDSNIIQDSLNRKVGSLYVEAEKNKVAYGNPPYK
jgi:predicted SAM-dependent methyltransferase